LKHVKSYKLFEEEEEETYSFEELSPEAQEKALDNNRDLNIDYDGWEDGVTEDFKEDMKEIGIDDITISYTGFNSQGDGASFTSDDIDTRKLFDAIGIKSNKALNMEVDDERSGGENKEFYDLLDTMEDIGQVDRNRIKPEEIRVWIKRTSSHYYHYNTVEAEVEIWDEPDGWEEPDTFTVDLADQVTEYVRELCKDLYRKLEKEYDYLTSDESVKETLIDSDYKFDEKGNLA
jgi:hypothetical protein